GEAVGNVARPDVRAPDVRDVDDAPRAAPPHGAGRRLRAEERAAQVHGHQSIELCRRGLEERRAEEQCRGVDEHVEPAESVDRATDDASCRDRSREIDSQRGRAYSERAQLRNGRPRFGARASIPDRDIGALAGQCERDRAADAHRAARHERDFAGQFLDTLRGVWFHRAAMTWSFRNWLKVRFLTGFFVTVPAIATAWLLYVFWDAIDDFFSPGYQHLFGRRIPGAGFLTAVVLIFFIGTIATNVVGRRIIVRIERLLAHVPIFRSIYPSVKQLLESFSPEKRN